MKTTTIICAVSLMAGAFALPALADEVIVDGPTYDHVHRHHRHHPGVTISDEGISVGTVRDRDRHDRYNDQGRCMTRSVTRTNSDGDQITKTMRRCD